MAAAENKAVVTSFAEEVVNQGQPERVGELLGFRATAPSSWSVAGTEQVIAFRTALPDVHSVIEEMVAEGERYLATFT